MVLNNRRTLGWLALLLIAGVAVTRPAAAASFAVTSALDAADASPGDGVCASTATGSPCTLRAAIQEANASAGADSITFSAGGPFAITLAGAGEDQAATGDLDIAPGGLTITGNGAAQTVIDGGALDRVLEVQASASLTLNDVTIRNGQTSTYGGGLASAGALTLNRVTLANNQAGLLGGGLFVGAGQAVVSRSLIHANQAAGDGGGAYLDSGAILRLVNVTVAANTATAGSGGGLYTNNAALVLFNVTVSGNTAAGAGGGVFGTASVRNSILAANTGDKDCGGTLNSQGYNFIGNPASCTVSGIATGNRSGANPLGGFNGQVFPLTGSSAAIDAGDPAGCVADAGGTPLTDDQMGNLRPQNGDGLGSAVCDMGAYEAPDVPTPTPTFTPSQTATPSPTATGTAPPSVTPAPTSTPGGQDQPPAPTATPSPTATAAARTYVVQAGDTLFWIAVRFTTTVSALQTANSLSDPGRLAVGQVLIIPPDSATTVVARAGDTLFSLARQYNTSVAALQAANGMGSRTILYAGQTVILPSGMASSPPPTASAPAGAYLVQPGDTLFRLALRFGTSVAALQAANGLGASTRLYAGQSLIIPGAAAGPLPTAPAPAAGANRHLVQPGETLFRLALRYGTTVAALQAANGLGASTLIYAGQTLIIPATANPPATPRPGQVHVVQPGETLFRLALRYGTTVAELQRANGLAGALIYAGQRLIIP